MEVEIDAFQHVAVVWQVSGFEAAEITALGFDRLGDVRGCVEDASGYGHPIAEGLQSLSVREVGVVVAFAKGNGRI